MMGRMKEYLQNLSDDYEECNEKDEALDREYPVKQRIDGFSVKHYYEGENPVWEIFDDDGKMIGIAHSHEELHSITDGIS